MTKAAQPARQAPRTTRSTTAMGLRTEPTRVGAGRRGLLATIASHNHFHSVEEPIATCDRQTDSRSPVPIVRCDRVLSEGFAVVDMRPRNLFGRVRYAHLRSRRGRGWGIRRTTSEGAATRPTDDPDTADAHTRRRESDEPRSRIS